MGNPYDISGTNALNDTDNFNFAGLSWSQDKNYHIMFDGSLNVTEYVNGAGSQSRNNGWRPDWNAKSSITPNLKFYSVGSQRTKDYWWPLWMGGWISQNDIDNDSFTDEHGDKIMLAANLQRVLFRSPTHTVLKIKDL